MRPLSTGGADRDRTDDLLNANQALFQLSYGPETKKSNRPFVRTKESEEREFASFKNYFV